MGGLQRLLLLIDSRQVESELKAKIPAEKVLSHCFGKKEKISKLVPIQYEPTNIYETNLKKAK